MTPSELNSTIPEIRSEDQPDLMAFSMLRNFVADLSPRPVSPGTTMWFEFRYRSTGEMNYSRWSKVINLDGQEHELTLCAVKGEMPGGVQYAHNTLRCNCCLPDYKSYKDLSDEYDPCPAKDLIIADRAHVYKSLVGVEQLGRLSNENLKKAIVFLARIVNNNPFAWPPSDRSDRLLLDPIAEVYDIEPDRVRTSAQELAEGEVIQLHGRQHPSISLAA
jgi:hypothetical protein